MRISVYWIPGGIFVIVAHYKHVSMVLSTQINRNIIETFFFFRKKCNFTTGILISTTKIGKLIFERVKSQKMSESCRVCFNSEQFRLRAETKWILCFLYSHSHWQQITVDVVNENQFQIIGWEIWRRNGHFRNLYWNAHVKNVLCTRNY